MHVLGAVGRRDTPAGTRLEETWRKRATLVRHNLRTRTRSFPWDVLEAQSVRDPSKTMVRAPASQLPVRAVAGAGSNACDGDGGIGPYSAAAQVRERAQRGQREVPRPSKLFTTFRSAAYHNNVVECFYIWGATSAPISAVKDANTSKPWVSFGSSTRRNGVTIVKRGDVRWAELDKRCFWHVCVEAPASVGG